MTKVTSIAGKHEPLCQYCGTVPQSKHPGYACPRIASFVWGGEELSVEYVDLDTWNKHLEIERARNAIAGTPDEAA